jgi:tetratricopeptide (TPR) repeat protein
MRKGNGMRGMTGDNRFLPVLLFLTLVVLTVLAYVRALHAPLLFDDLIYITPAKLKNLFRHIHLHVRSVAELSFALNYTLWGMNLAAFRVVNVIFHICSAFSASYLVYATLNLPSIRGNYRPYGEGKTPLQITLLVATLFLLHPIQTSAVNYVTQRMAIMAAMFSFVGFIFYVKGVTGGGRRAVVYYLVSAFSFVLAIFSKENAVMALFMLPVYDFFFLSAFRWREFRRRFMVLSALLVALGAIVSYKMNIVGFAGKIADLLSHLNQPIERYAWTGMDVDWTPVEYLLTELRVVSRYLFLILVPVPSFMAFDYSNAYPVSKDLFTPLTTVFALLFLIALVVIALGFRKRAPLISFGILWYLVTISLESFIALGLDPYFEHRNYLPGFGIFLALSSLLVYVDGSRIAVRREAVVVSVALLLAVLTFARNGVWRDGRHLWEEAVNKAPTNVRARLNLGTVYVGSGLLDEAIDQYRTALAQKPDDPGAHLNMGEAYLKKGWTDDAIKEFQTALRLPARSPSERKKYDVYYNLGLAFYTKGQVDKAMEQYRIALEIKPDFAEAHVNLGIAFGAHGMTDKAMEQFRTAVQLNPELAVARYNLGTSLLRSGSAEAAVEQYLAALRLNPAYAEAHNNLGSAYRAMGSTDKAAEHFREAARLRPGFAEAHINMGISYEAAGSFDKAIEEYQTALKLNPSSAEAHKNLGVAYHKKGWVDKAIEEYRAASKLDPSSADAHKYLGDAFYSKSMIEKAIEEYKVAVKLDPRNAVARYNLGVAYYNVGVAAKMKGFITMARKQFEAAVELDPNDQRFRGALAKIEGALAKIESPNLAQTSGQKKNGKKK